jgi:hypothetical protein
MHANAGPERRQARCEQPALKLGVLISIVLRPARSTSGSEFEDSKRTSLKREHPALPRFTASERVRGLRAVPEQKKERKGMPGRASCGAEDTIHSFRTREC